MLNNRQVLLLELSYPGLEVRYLSAFRSLNEALGGVLRFGSNQKVNKIDNRDFLSFW